MSVHDFAFIRLRLSIPSSLSVNVLKICSVTDGHAASHLLLILHSTHQWECCYHARVPKVSGYSKPGLVFQPFYNLLEMKTFSPFFNRKKRARQNLGGQTDRIAAGFLHSRTSTACKLKNSNPEAAAGIRIRMKHY